MSAGALIHMDVAALGKSLKFIRSLPLLTELVSEASGGSGTVSCNVAKCCRTKVCLSLRLSIDSRLDSFTRSLELVVRSLEP